ncbi:peptide deformylase [Acetobacter orleanensis]|uniref:Peptide deformylase-like n=1 Tax=Acetobacter orleanensis TaxID=104099 RepID=A0A4Y3TM89_9PROT|nr:peptide deformylase [Acetobacter orleanensis]KXV62595.1 peptide deformylase [Acetobacter orleanensis]PCD79956.1 peptide deformylase [Acetobacter orleanensis]GAN68264.1 peptide deformylase [Acetobacter orleanensis JCM 7639]GBR31201.1 N-formylmethionylaminoacyl-tRNA deformylase [Acetobacter orleanensis NRIC 0473]GEB82843.1 peptide deformylase-like protein [Acetobacter orleanensis]
MTICPIIRFPDQRLRQVAEPVTVFDHTLSALAQDILESMRAAPGIGMTAPHIGIARRVVVLELPDAAQPQTYVNPEILWMSEDKVRQEEGSVSMPGVTEQIERAARVRVAYHDLDGVRHEEEAEGLRAACHQHEIDQLNGLFWLQRLSSLRRNRLIARYEKMQRFRP